MPRIFDLYFTGKNGRTNNNSSGIGLYLVKQILEQLGHKIKVESEQSKGTKFTIYFD
ncbi:ATP-binding protein [Anaerococcus hydrogenalis]|uniref:ATP-binding protein n=1 Tax=Anaerococcus hydrogenalis TaxID=33029 RepID=UPI003C6BF7DD